MQGIWLENQTLSLRHDLAIPKPSSGEALVKVLHAGICNTDLELVKGYYPYQGILGHEFVGIVEQGPAHLLHKRVVGEINVGCGQCEWCQRHCHNHCPNRTVLGIVNHHGAFAEYLVLPPENLHCVPDTVSNDEAIFTEPLAAALEIQQQLSIKPNDKILVLGAGKLGLLIAQTLKLRGCELLVMDRNPEKIDLLSTWGIAGELFNAASARSAYFDVVVECTGNPEGAQLALRSVKPRGRIVLKSTYAAPLTIDAAQIVVNEIQLIGSRCGPFKPALQLLADKLIQVSPLVQAHYPLAQGLEAFKKAEERKALKVIVTNEVKI
ncbi:MAG: alcohol dehydrogenase catalytic domain-containing protein [Gammaproteobacteria bacterium]